MEFALGFFFLLVSLFVTTSLFMELFLYAFHVFHVHHANHFGGNQQNRTSVSDHDAMALFRELLESWNICLFFFLIYHVKLETTTYLLYRKPNRRKKQQMSQLEHYLQILPKSNVKVRGTIHRTTPHSNPINANTEVYQPSIPRKVPAPRKFL